MRKVIPLGTFSVVSGTLVVSDPCYTPDVWCRGELKNVRVGEWNASMVETDQGNWGIRVGVLSIRHQDIHSRKGLIRHEAPFEVGVDSGQAGFFDERFYRDDSVITQQPPQSWSDGESKWYDYCCSLTLSPTQGGVLPYGAVTSSGYGDGVYSCYYYTNEAGEIVMAEIKFL